MQVSTVNSTLTDTSTSDSSSRVPIQTLGQEDFLKLLVMQLRQQDPLNPQKDTDFIAQMAQFSTLEQQKTLNGDMTSLLGGQQILQANALIGRVVGVQDSSGNLVTGAVDGVQVTDGVTNIIVNGQAYALSSVLAILPAPTNSETSATNPQGVQP